MNLRLPLTVAVAVLALAACEGASESVAGRDAAVDSPLGSPPVPTWTPEPTWSPLPTYTPAPTATQGPTATPAAYANAYRYPVGHPIGHRYPAADGDASTNTDADT
jgi:hypothetical protein